MPTPHVTVQECGNIPVQPVAPPDPSALPRSVTIIVNNFNYEQYLRAAIDSALAQTCPAQVVVVDDASTDGSAAIITSFGDRVLAVLKSVNGGQASAMNEGVRVATGDVVLFLDSDDLLVPDAVATLLARWKPGTVMAQFPLTIIDAEGTHLGVYPDPPSGLAEGDLRPLLLATGGFVTTVTTGLAFARGALAQVLPIPEQPFRLAADGYLTRAVPFLGTVQRIDERLGCYRKHGRNDSDVCAAPGGLAEGFRKKITHADNEFGAIRDIASRQGLTVAPDLGEGRADYIGYRLFSLLIAPHEHPYAGDRRVPLLYRYVRARWNSKWRLQRKILAIALASAATLGTPGISGTLVRWLHDPNSRPTWFPSRGSARA